VRKYKRGDKVEWWSYKGKVWDAVFVAYDPDFPRRDCILAIRIGAKGNRMIHTFRWPLRQVALNGEGRTMMTRQRTKGV
jgi:hypothetical protein